KRGLAHVTNMTRKCRSINPSPCPRGHQRCARRGEIDQRPDRVSRETGTRCTSSTTTNERGRPDDAVEAPGTRDETAVELLGVVGGGEIEHVIAARRFWPRTCIARARRRRRHGLDLPARHESTAR